MTKSDTRQLKGLAILMMLWLHLFSDLKTVRTLDYWLDFVNGLPLAYSLTRLASACVPIYIFLGGYGLAATYLKADGHRLQAGRRALMLMVNFWLVFAVFIPIGCWVNPLRYPGDGITLLLNALAVRYNYNGAWWFLMPYVLLTLSSPYVIRRSMEGSRRKNRLWLGALAVVHVAVYLVQTYLPITDARPLPGVATLLNYLSMLFLFGMGVMAVKYDWMNRLRRRLSDSPQTVLAVLLAVLCLVKMSLGGSSLLNVPFILLLIPLLMAVRWPQWVHSALAFLGRHSTNMWLVHYFFYFIFGMQIYQLRYPLLMFLLLTITSVGCSLVLQPIVERLKKRDYRGNVIAELYACDPQYVLRDAADSTCSSPSVR